MQKQNLRNELEHAWERAVIQAAEDTARHESANPDELNTAAGLRIQSGVKAGDWVKTYTDSGYSCGCG